MIVAKLYIDMQALKGLYMFAVADHGGLIAAVRRFYITNVI